MKLSITALSLYTISTPFVSGFSISSSTSTKCKKYNIQNHLCSSKNTIDDQPTNTFKNNEEDSRGGIDIFETWFQSITTTTTTTTKSDTNILLRHNFFSNGRGLEFVGKKSDLLANIGQPIITLPKEYVLQSTFVDKEKLEDISSDWDVTLAMKLLRECKLGTKSSLYGYCSLLTRGQDFNNAKPCPPSTAPDSIRNWSEEEKQMLTSTQRGQRLLRAEQSQSQEWKDKYLALSSIDREQFSYEQFKWAMEAVNSRAFKGNFTGQEPLKELSKALVPFAAGAFALNYIRSDPFGADENITLLLLLFSCAPVILNFLSDNFSDGKIEAVMLPFIDSANHKESAQSEISFDPLKGAFTVSVEGGNCIEEDGTLSQFYISYGRKFDTELLLNYGFLNGLRENNESQAERRRLLADTFNARSLQ